MNHRIGEGGGGIWPWPSLFGSLKNMKTGKRENKRKMRKESDNNVNKKKIESGGKGGRERKGTI